MKKMIVLTEIFVLLALNSFLYAGSGVVSAVDVDINAVYVVNVEVKATVKTSNRCAPKFSEDILDYTVSGEYSYSADKNKAYAKFLVRGGNLMKFISRLESEKKLYKVSSYYPAPVPTPTAVGK